MEGWALATAADCAGLLIGTTAKTALLLPSVVGGGVGSSSSAQPLAARSKHNRRRCCRFWCCRRRRWGRPSAAAEPATGQHEQQRNSNSGSNCNNSKDGSRLSKIAAALAAVGIAVAAAVFFAVLHVEVQADEARIERVCGQLQFQFQCKIQEVLDNLWSSTVLFIDGGGGVGTGPTASAFENWARAADDRRHDFVHVLFAPRVNARDRSAYEQQFGAIHQSPANQTSAGPGLFYYPIQYAYPAVNKAVLNGDTWNHETRNGTVRKAVLKSVTTAAVIRPVATSFAKEKTALSIVMPVYFSNVSAIVRYYGGDSDGEAPSSSASASSSSSAASDSRLADGIVEGIVPLKRIIGYMEPYLREAGAAMQIVAPDGTVLIGREDGEWPTHAPTTLLPLSVADQTWTAKCASKNVLPVTFAPSLALAIALLWITVVVCGTRITWIAKSYEAARADAFHKQNLLFSTQMKLNSLAVNATAILRAIGDALVIVDNEGFIQFANRKASALFGYRDFCGEVPLYERHYRHFFSDIPDNVMQNSLGSEEFPNPGSSYWQNGTSSSVLMEGMRDIIIINRDGNRIQAEANVSRLTTRLSNAEPSGNSSSSGRPSGGAGSRTVRRSPSRLAAVAVVPSSCSGATESVWGQKLVGDAGEQRQQRQHACVILFRDITAKLASAHELCLAKMSAERDGKINADLLSFVSQTLRSPLHAIGGALVSLDDVEVGPQVRGWYKALASQLQAMETIVRDVALYQTTALSERVEKFSLVSLLRELTATHGCMAKCGGLTLEVEVHVGDKSCVSFAASVASECQDGWNKVKELVKSSGCLGTSFNGTAEPTEAVFPGKQHDKGLPRIESGYLPKLDPVDDALRLDDVGGGCAEPSWKRDGPFHDLPDIVEAQVESVGDILENLLMYAMKFTQVGSVRFSVSCTQRVGDVCTIHVTVKDSCDRFSEDELNNIFNPFAESDRSTIGRLHGGTGLCLAIVKKLVEFMGGTIQATSQAGSGTSVAVDLPVQLCEADDSDVPSSVNYTRCKQLCLPDECLSRQSSSSQAAKSQRAPQAGDGDAQQSAANVDIRRQSSLLSIECLSWDSSSSPAAKPLHCGDPIVRRRKSSQSSLCAGPRSLRHSSVSPSNTRLSSELSTGASVGSVTPPRAAPNGTTATMTTAPQAPAEPGVSQETSASSPGFLPPDARAAFLWPATGSPPAAVKSTQTFSQENPGAGPRTTAAASSSPASQPRVLVVDDNQIIQRLQCKQLRKIGYLVDVADNGAQAIELVQTARGGGRLYDAILMDLNMPVMDGITAAAKLRNDLQWTGVLVAVTANVFQQARDQCKAAGFNHFVPKPVKFQELAEQVSALLQAGENQGSAPAVG